MHSLPHLIWLLLWCLLLAPGCRHNPPLSDIKPPREVSDSGRAAGDTGADRAAAEATSTEEGLNRPNMVIIRGRLLDFNGQPMKLAHAHVGKTSAQANVDGSFELTIEKAPYVKVLMTGVDHIDWPIGLWLEDRVTPFEVRLGTYARPHPEKPLTVTILDSEMAFKGKEPMVQHADGIWYVDIDTESGDFFYEIDGLTVAGNTLNGTQAERFVYDQGGNYASVLTAPGGSLRIDLDPAALPPAGQPTQVDFEDPTSLGARLTVIQQGIERRSREERRIYGAMREITDSDARRNAVWEAIKAKGWHKSLEELISTSTEPLLQQALYIAYFSIMLPPKDSTPEAYVALAMKGLEAIPPDSPLWAMSPIALMSTTAVISRLEPDLARAYQEAVAEKNSSSHVVGWTLVDLMRRAGKDKNDEDVLRYYRRITTDFEGTRWARLAQVMAPDRSIMAGKPLPKFDFEAFDLPGTRYSIESFGGKVLLLDFWATWCNPCVEEMDALHALYEKHSGQGFEILSIAMGDEPEAVRRFHEDRFAMPWQHVVLNDESVIKVVQETFEVPGIPRVVLVSGDGTIVNGDFGLRGEMLAAAVAQALEATNSLGPSN